MGLNEFSGLKILSYSLNFAGFNLIAKFFCRSVPNLRILSFFAHLIRLSFCNHIDLLATCLLAPMKRMLNHMVTSTDRKNDSKDNKIVDKHESLVPNEQINSKQGELNHSNSTQKNSFQNFINQNLKSTQNAKSTINQQIVNKHAQNSHFKPFQTTDNQEINLFDQNIGISSRSSTFNTNTNGNSMNQNTSTNTFAVKPTIKLSVNEENNNIFILIESNKQVVQVLSQYLSASKKRNSTQQQRQPNNVLSENLGENCTNSLRFDSIRNIWTFPLSHFAALSSHLKKHFKFDKIPRDTIQILSKSDVLEQKDYCEDESIHFKTIKQFLLPHQLEVLNAPERVLLADEMGLGKTISALALAARHTADWPVLIVTPGGLCDNWLCEVMRFMMAEDTEGESEEISVTSNRKRKKKRKVRDDDIVSVIRSRTDIKNQSILIVSYDFLSRNIDYFRSYQLENDLGNSSSNASDEITGNITNLNKQKTSRTSTITNLNIKKNINFIICDEAHYLKTPNTKRSRAIVPFLKSVNRVVLCTGTPALSRPAELYVLVDVLTGFSYRDFTNRYCVFTNNSNNSKFNKYNQFKGCSNETELKLVLSKLMIRRTKSELMTDMPKKSREHFKLD